MAQGLVNPPPDAGAPAWLSPSVDKLSQLLTLAPNWDSYGAQALDPQHALAALCLLGRVMHNDSPPPSVVPTSRGSVQLEWHTNGVDLEISVLAPNEFHVQYESAEESWERNLISDLSLLRSVISQFSTVQ
jgi:hypothetical protein